MSSLSVHLREYIAAAFSGIWIQSFEHEDALAEIAGLCREHHWALATWDVDRGLRSPSAGEDAAATPGSDPLAAIKALNALTSSNDQRAAAEGGISGDGGEAERTAVLLMVNLHRFLGSAEIVQALAHQIAAGKHNRTFVVVLAPVVQIPLELERLFVVIEHELPDRDQLRAIAAGIATEPGELPEGAALETVLDAAAGLTRYEAENAFSLSVLRERKISPESVWELKTQTLKKSGLLELHRGSETFGDLGGLDALKQF